MGYLKKISIVALGVFCLIYLVTNEKLRKELKVVLSCNVGKIKVKDIFVILIMLIIIFSSIINWLDVYLAYGIRFNN